MKINQKINQKIIRRSYGSGMGEWFIFGCGWNGLRMTSDFGLRGGDDWPVQCLPHQSVSGGGGRQVGAVEVMTFC